MPHHHHHHQICFLVVLLGITCLLLVILLPTEFAPCSRSLRTVSGIVAFIAAKVAHCVYSCRTFCRCLASVPPGVLLCPQDLRLSHSLLKHLLELICLHPCSRSRSRCRVSLVIIIIILHRRHRLLQGLSLCRMLPHLLKVSTPLVWLIEQSSLLLLIVHADFLFFAYIHH